MVDHTQIAYTEPGMPEPGEVVRFVNITLTDDVARITVRDNLGDLTVIDLAKDDWAAFAHQIAETVR